MVRWEIRDGEMGDCVAKESCIIPGVYVRRVGQVWELE